MKKRLLSLIMAIVMAATLLPWSGIAAIAKEFDEPSSQKSGPGITINSAGDILRRPVPNVSLDVTDVTRVASTQYSMAKGTTIVKATPSGVPELAATVSWRIRHMRVKLPLQQLSPLFSTVLTVSSVNLILFCWVHPHSPA